MAIDGDNRYKSKGCYLWRCPARYGKSETGRGNDCIGEICAIRVLTRYCV